MSGLVLKKGIEAISSWLLDMTRIGEWIRNGTCDHEGNKWAFFQFDGPGPTPLPCNLCLNYVSLRKADKLDRSDYIDAVKWLNTFDSCILVNSQHADSAHITRGRATGAELVRVLSDVVLSTGPIVNNPLDENPDMRLQCVVTKPFRLTPADVSILDPLARAKFLDDPRIAGRYNIQDIADEIDE